MEYLTLIGIAILIIVVIGFYMFYMRLNDSNTRVEELRRTVKLLDKDNLDMQNKVNELNQNAGTGAVNNGGNQCGVDNVGNRDNKCNGDQCQRGGRGDRGEGENSQAKMEGANHGKISNEKRAPVNICANSEPSEGQHSNGCTNYAPIPDEEDNVQLKTMENISEFPIDYLSPV